MLLTVFAVVIGLMALLRVYLRLTTGRCTSEVDLTGKTVLITGANTGIGYYTALDLAKRNARVLVVCRNQQKGKVAVNSIKEITGNQNVVLYIGDVSLMSSVRELAGTVLKQESRLDILVNNAGSGGLPYSKTEEGLETVMATNHLGPFLLTALLLDLVKKSTPSRIVNVSSMAFSMAKLDVNDLNKEKVKVSEFSPRKQYANSKLCNILFTRELARRLEGTGVTTYSLHPGVVATDIWRNVKGAMAIILAVMKTLYFKTSEEGAQTSIYCAVSEELAGVTGKYYSDCKEAEHKSTKEAKDAGLAKKLWELSEQLTGLAK